MSREKYSMAVQISCSINMLYLNNWVFIEFLNGYLYESEMCASEFEIFSLIFNTCYVLPEYVICFFVLNYICW